MGRFQFPFRGGFRSDDNHHQKNQRALEDWLAKATEATSTRRATAYPDDKVSVGYLERIALTTWDEEVGEAWSFSAEGGIIVPVDGIYVASAGLQAALDGNAGDNDGMGICIVNALPDFQFVEAQAPLPSGAEVPGLGWAITGFPWKLAAGDEIGFFSLTTPSMTYSGGTPDLGSYLSITKIG